MKKIILLSLIAACLFIISCKEKTEITENVKTDENKTEIIVPYDLPEDAILDFKIPELPDYDLWKAPPMPQDVKEIVSKIIPSNKTHEWDEPCKMDVWKEYDDKGRVIHEWNTQNFERWTDYSGKGIRILSTYEYVEYDEKQRKLHTISPTYESFTEYSDYEDYYTYVSKDVSGIKSWGKYQGNTTFHYSEYDEEERGHVKEWNTFIYEKPFKIGEPYDSNKLKMSTKHSIQQSEKRFLETWRVNKYEQTQSITWDWDSKGYSQRIISKGKNGNSNNLRYYYKNDERNNSGSFNAGDFSYYHEWFSSGTDRHYLSEKGIQIISTNQDYSKNETGVTIFDPETGRRYSIHLSKDGIYYQKEDTKNKTLDMLSIGYSPEENTSNLYRRHNFEDEWICIYPEPEAENKSAD